MSDKSQLADYIRAAKKIEIVDQSIGTATPIVIDDKVRNPEDTGWELRGEVGVTGRPREHAYYAWPLPDQEFTHRLHELADVFDSDGKIVQIRFE